MASRVILRKRRSLFSSPPNGQYTRFIFGFSSVGRGQPLESNEFEGLIQFPFCSSATTGHRREENLFNVNKDDMAACAATRFISNSLFRVSSFGFRTDKIELVSLSRLGWISQCTRYISTAATDQSGLGSSNRGSEQSATKQTKEASPEECDEAVEDLSTVKAKAKAKQLQEPQKSADSILKRLWARILGIGPAFRTIMSMSRDDWAKKFSHWWDEFKSTLQHYWFGTKLLWADIRISSRLLLKLAGGKNLSRRERQQLTRTTADIFRLVPFAVFIIVPFMELLLPVFLKLFPNMLPSTFQDKMKEQEALKRRLNARIEYAKFLQDTVKEMAKEIQNSRSGEMKKTAEDLDEFMNKVRTGARVSNDEILGFAKLFNDELTLDNISRPRLVNMCKYMGINPYGTDAYLRYMLRKRLQEIKNDDILIQAEGVESLSEAELRQACRDRGLLGLLSVEEMRQQLKDWLDLSLNHSVPSSLLILSRAFSVSGKVRPEEAVQATLSSLPDEVVDTVGVTTLPSEDSVSERKRKLEYLEMQEELIKEEEKKKEAEQAKMTESIGSERDLAMKERASMTKQTQEEVKTKTLDNQEHLSKLSRALAVLASASSVSREREEFLRLVRKEMELYDSMVGKEGTEGEQEAKKAYQAARKESDGAIEAAISDKISSALVDRVDNMLQTLEKEIDDVDAKIGDRWRLLDRDYDGKVTPEEVVSAAMYLKDTLGKEGIHELISNLSKDRDGKILVEDIVKLGAHNEDADTNEVGRS
ncbi:mitochondrial proton/calcium exchanger protein-like isoform X2 [Abrus precatorius]|uniref:Mitochondrial proton/calcium exchanger protein n=1 Tax=Abrus precatorius TaxID=3816 RepID=A0A8B8L1E6_ABRPR|nr:mitochondrial proton/calcium exchanger protein-like isoform X2 [Abrus precatorius]